MYGNGDVRTHQGADAAAGAIPGFLFIDFGRRITHAVDARCRPQNPFGAEGDAEVATFAPFRIYDDIA